MEDQSQPIQTRFPWGYALATLIPIALIGGVFGSSIFLDGPERMTPAMLCSLLIGPVGALVVGWGCFRLWEGDRQQYPALRWLVCVPGLVGLAGMVLS